MAVISVVMLRGQKAPLYATVSASTGTVGVSGATFTLYSRRAVVLGPVACSNEADAATVNVWYDLDTSGLSPGSYYGAFSIPVTASGDAISRTEEIDVVLYVRKVPA